MVRFRRVGLYAGRCQAQLAQCRELLQLDAAETNPVEDSASAASDPAASDHAGDHDGEDDVTDCEEDEQVNETLPRCPACQKIPLRWLGYVPGHRTTRRFTRLRPFVPETLAEALLLKSMIAHSVCPSNAAARPP
ncbi:MAG: hypothetical protein U0795_01910 [Pirellulales bacterium]